MMLRPTWAATRSASMAERQAMSAESAFLRMIRPMGTRQAQRTNRRGSANTGPSAGHCSRSMRPGPEPMKRSGMFSTAKNPVRAMMLANSMIPSMVMPKNRLMMRRCNTRGSTA